MKIINSLKDIETLNIADKVGVTIGNFDGVHIGHRDLISTIKNDCLLKNQKMVVITFVPHTGLRLYPRNNYLLNSYLDRRELLESSGVDLLLEIDFTDSLGQVMPDVFLDNYIFNNSVIKSLYLGYDFSFGRNRSGTSAFVKDYCKHKNIEMFVQSPFSIENNIISSTVVRKLLLSGDVDTSRKYLGRDFFLEGKIERGAGRGKKIGFATANLCIADELIKPSGGVYLTQTLYNGELYYSLTNIGTNPTFKSDKSVTVETHLLNFDQDIYDQEIKVFFKTKIRDERKFENVDDLISQLKSDVSSAENYFKL